MNTLFSWLRSLFSEQATTLAEHSIAAPSSSTPPPTGESWTIPVLLLHYFPVKNGQIDISVTGDIGGSLERMRQHTANTSQRVVSALEAGSTYHGYKDPAAQPSLRYQIVDSLEFLQPLPTWRKPGRRAPMTDYNAIMRQIEISDWVQRRGIKEVWIWGYHGGVVDLWESNMSSPWGDVSNSDRDPHDLPVLDRTYTVYHYNYQRGPSEAVEDHMHQIEAQLRHVDPQLFWERFVGKVGEGRCGWSHYPPNGAHDYDWANPTHVWSDIEDWRPDGDGQKVQINCDRWRRDSLTWFIYWMQNLPGKDNGLTYRGRPLTNWWHLIGDWDGAMEKRIGLTK